MSHYLKLIKVASLVLLAVTLIACHSEESRPLSLGLLSDENDFVGFSRADKVIEITFPEDHGAHLDFATEWWYVTGIVDNEEGRKWGFQYTLFRSALVPPSESETGNRWRTGQVYMSHFAVSDLADESHVSFERISRGHDQLAGVQIQPFQASLGDWHLKSIGPDFSPLELSAGAADYAIDLQITEAMNPILHGERGLSQKSPTNASYYYSLPRLGVHGLLDTPDGQHQVSGLAWFDHEWSTGLLDPKYQGWYWTTLHLEDGQDLVLFSLVPRQEEEEVTAVGLRVSQNGETESLSESFWAMTPTRYWRNYPIEWELTLGNRHLVIEPAFDNQLMQTTITYWEGVVYVQEDGAIVGEGYLELTGY